MEAKCVKCGKRYCGWALTQRKNRTCECGGKLKIIKPRQRKNDALKGKADQYH